MAAHRYHLSKSKEALSRQSQNYVEVTSLSPTWGQSICAETNNRPRKT